MGRDKNNSEEYKWAKTKHLQRVYFNENIDAPILGYVAPPMALTYKNCTKMD